MIVLIVPKFIAYGKALTASVFCAKDSVGNKSILAPLAIEAIEASAAKQLYLPFMMTDQVAQTDNNLGPYKQYMPMIAYPTQTEAGRLTTSPLMLRFVEGSVCQ